MKSGIVQASPQIAVPRTTIVGRSARDDAQRGDFAEALGLGKPARQANSVDGKSAAEDAEAPPSHGVSPRLAPKPDHAIHGVQEGAQRLKAESPQSIEVEEAGDPGAEIGADAADLREATVDPREIRNDESATPDAPLPQPARNVAVVSAPVQAPMPAAVPAAATGSTGNGTSREAAVPAAERHAGADHDVAFDAKVPSSRTSGLAGEKPGASSFMPMGFGDKPEADRFEPGIRPSASTDRSSADRVQLKETPPQAPAEAAGAAPRVTVLAQQSIAAPTPSTALTLPQSIASGELLEPSAARFSPDAIHASAMHGSAQSLKIQLHPAELGLVTATLRFAGEQLSIELQVENQEAYRRLSGDSDVIVNSLRGLGYEIDRVTVLQPSIASTFPGRADSAAISAPHGRSADQFGSGLANGGSGGSGGHSPEHVGNAGRNGQRNPSPRTEDSGVGLYI